MSTAPVKIVPLTPLPLLRVTFTHEYFGGAFSEFRAVPFASTASSCRRLGLKLVRDEASLTLYATADAVRRIPRSVYRRALSELTLCWQIAPLSAEFPAFTDLAIVAASQSLVFTTLASGAEGGALTVASTASSADVWSRHGLRFDYQPTQKILAGEELTLKDATGAALSTITVINPNLLNIDVSAFGSGLYQLTQGDTVLMRWFADERGLSPSLPTTVLVLPGALLLAAFSNSLRSKGSRSKAPVYTAAYAAREVIWRYRVFNAGTAERLSIVPFMGEALSPQPATAGPSRNNVRARKTAKPRAAFVAVNDPSLPAARSFEAVNPLKLAQRPAQRFALNSGASTRFAPLPLAGLSFGRSLRSPALCSEIFVYL